MFEKCSPFKNFHSVVVDVNPYHESGASIVQEVAIALATGVEYLSKLSDNEKKYSIENIASKIQFKMPIASSYFMEIAKFRATRFLWSKIIESFGVKNDDNKKLYIHANTSNYNKTIYDTNVNMLRVTSEAMSAVIGGVDELTILPYDITVNDEADEFSLRIARNVQHMIKDECKLDKIVDPAGGSYYIEYITNSIITKAWELFNTIEDKGGIVEVIKSGFIQDEIKSVQDKREKDIAFRKQTIVGTNQYPNSLDIKSENLNIAFDKSNSESKILTPKRASENFENLRFRTEKFNKENNREVTAFLATLGNLTMRKARASFSTDFLGAGGIKIIDNNGFADYKEAFAEFKNSEAEIIVICSSDDDYKEMAEDFTKLVKSELPESTVVLAGYPKEIIKPLEAAGVNHFINIKSNVIEVIEKIQQKIMES
jgi:methylmalonyl-CoA mutase